MTWLRNVGFSEQAGIGSWTPATVPAFWVLMFPAPLVLAGLVRFLEWAAKLRWRAASFSLLLRRPFLRRLGGCGSLRLSVRLLSLFALRLFARNFGWTAEARRKLFPVTCLL
jgi:hypothetical protein